MNIAAPPYATMSLDALKVELAGWDRMLVRAIATGYLVDQVRQHRAPCAAEVARREAQGVAA